MTTKRAEAESHAEWLISLKLGKQCGILSEALTLIDQLAEALYELYSRVSWADDATEQALKAAEQWRKV